LRCFCEINLLDLKGLEEVKKYSFFSPSSIPLVKSTLVDTKEGRYAALVFLFFLLAVFSGFNCLVSAVTSSNIKAKDFF
jgi:hypothetical protein